MKKRGRGVPDFSASPASSLQYPASRTICATWRLYPLWPQSIAHTSCHHGGVLHDPPSRNKMKQKPVLARKPTNRRISKVLASLWPNTSTAPRHRGGLPRRRPQSSRYLMIWSEQNRSVPPPG